MTQKHGQTDDDDADGQLMLEILARTPLDLSLIHI